MYYFLLGYEPRQVLSSWLVGVVIATFAIEFAFGQIFKFRKRSSYPNALVLQLGAATTVDAAAASALEALRDLLKTSASFLALREQDGPKLTAATGMDERTAGRILQACASSLKEAADTRAPVWSRGGGETGLASSERIVFVPIVAIHEIIGVLAFVTRGRRMKELKDDQLLTAIGDVLGLLLENLRRKEEIRQRETDNRTLLDAIPDAILRIRRDGAILSFKPSQDAQVTSAEMEGRNAFELLSDDVVARARRAVETALETGEPQVLEFDLQRGGETRCREARIVVSGEDEVLTIVRDITDRKRAEMALRENEERFRALIEHSTDMISLLNDEGTITYASPSVSRFLGYSLDEYVGRNGFDLMHPDDITRMRGLFQQLLDNPDAPITTEFRLRHKEGSWRWIEGTAANLLHDPAVRAIVTNYRDITGRKEAGEALRESEERFRRLAENAEDIIYRYRLVPERGFEYVSPAATVITGYTSEEHYADPDLGLRIVHPEDRPLLEQYLRGDGEFDRSIIIRWLRKDGSTIWIEQRNVLIRDELGNAVAIEGIARDVTERKRAEDALLESEFKFRTLSETVAAAAFIFQGTRMCYVNSAAEAITGYSRDELLEMDFWDVIHPDFKDLVRERGLARQRGDDVPKRYEVKLITRNGEERWIGFMAGAIDFEGRPAVLGTAFDITDLKWAEEALRESQRTLSTLMSNLPGMAYRCLNNENWTMEFASEGCFELTGYQPTDLVGNSKLSFADLIHPDDRESVWADVQAALRESRPFQLHYRIITAAGQEKWVWEQGRGIFGLDGEVVALEGFITDVTERKRAEETVRHLAYHDTLTGLPNRSLFEDRLNVALAQARRKGQPLAVMFLDLDQFKLVNDTLGHTSGDRLLQSVAKRLTGILREGDTVARVGGDEFTLLFPETGEEQAVEIAERILKAFRRPWLVDGQEFHVTTSIGIAMYDGDGKDTHSLLREADTAMYRAKDRGRNNFQLYTPAMNARIAQRLALENDLRRALDRDEFKVYYQPQLDVRTGRVIGAEALVRWQHPERGLVLPADFVPFAEEAGLILPVGETVIRAACGQAKTWLDKGIPLGRIAVNVSAHRLHQSNGAETVARILAETGLPPDRLQLELTESAIMDNLDVTMEVLEALRETGVTIAVDDFGTGYSSLSYLRRLPIDAVKIDRSFIGDLTVDPHDRAIVATIIAMAHGLGLKVIAEGVEIEEQLAFLKDNACDEWQGFLFSKAVPAAQFERLVNGKKRSNRVRAAVE